MFYKLRIVGSNPYQKYALRHLGNLFFYLVDDLLKLFMNLSLIKFTAKQVTRFNQKFFFNLPLTTPQKFANVIDPPKVLNF